MQITSLRHNSPLRGYAEKNSIVKTLAHVSSSVRSRPRRNTTNKIPIPPAPLPYIVTGVKSGLDHLRSPREIASSQKAECF